MRGIEQYLQVDAATLGALKYQGTWDASTNTPTLTSSVGVQGQYYVVSVAGSTNLNGETNWQVGDWAVFNGSVWQKVDGGSTGLLTTLTVTGNTYLATTSGNVGIGTSSPVNNSGYGGLTLNGASGAIISMLENGSETFRVTNATGYSFVNTTGSTPLLIGTNATERMRITSTGDVGIGTSSPSFPLDVNGFMGVGAKTAVSGLGGNVRYRDDTGTQRYITGILGSAGETSFSIYDAIAGDWRVQITSSGNLGIGTSSPSYKLDVAGSARLTNAEFIYFNNSTGTAKTVLGYFSDNNTYLDASDGAIIFRSGTGPNERMRLDSSGNLLVGTTSNTNTAKVFSLATASGPAFACQGYSGDVAAPAAIFGKYDNDSTTSQIFVRFTINNNSAGSGQINADGASAAAFGSYSDVRLKENISNLPSQLGNICALRPVEFDYKDGSGHQIGFVAQEMQQVYPDVVAPGQDEMLMVTGWSKTEARLVKAIQEQQAIIESLKARLDAANL